MPYHQVPTDVDADLYSLRRLEDDGWTELDGFISECQSRFAQGDYSPQPARSAEIGETRIIVADIHGNPRNLYRLLLAGGAISPDGRKNPGYWVCQLGDLLHCGTGVWEGDRDTSLIGPEWVDNQLLGNHELPYITKRIDSTFAGQHYHLHPDLDRRLRINMQSGHYQAAAAVDGWLVSHAGADPRLLRDAGMLELVDDTSALAEALNTHWIERLSGRRDPEPLMDWIDHKRGGRNFTGSIFWCTYSELMRGYQKMSEMQGRLRQIVGHTPRAKGPYCRNGIWNIDLRGIETGMVSALIKRPDQEQWHPIVLGRAKLPPTTITEQVLPGSH